MAREIVRRRAQNPDSDLRLAVEVFKTVANPSK
jgi:hypothetical protein